MAGAYTVFANNGVHLKPWMLASVRNANGDIVADFTPEAKQILDPRTAFLTQSLMQGAMTFGTASAVRGHGFNAPAAGKTVHRTMHGSPATPPTCSASSGSATTITPTSTRSREPTRQRPSGPSS
jgi:hypothetical protein